MIGSPVRRITGIHDLAQVEGRRPGQVDVGVLKKQVIWIWCLVLVVSASTALSDPIDFSGHQVVAVRLDTDADVQFLLSLELASEDFDVWSEGVGVGVVQVRVSPEQRAVLEASGLRYRVLTQDVQALVVGERGGGPGFFDAFRTNDEINDFLNGLAAQYPQLATMVNFGTSWQGRPMWGLHITGTTGTKPGILIHGCEHAREWLTPQTVAFAAEHLLTNYDTDPFVQLLVDQMDWYFLPVMNPDGYVYTWTTNRFWRKNRRGTFGVDLNRNWGYFWGGVGSSGSQSSDLYRGPSPFSEPETQALRDFLLAHPQVRGHVDLHTFGTLLMWPWGHTIAYPPDQSTFVSVGSVMRDLVAAVHGLQYLIGPVYSTIYPASGVSVDWVYAVAGRWSFTFELRGAGFAVPPDQILLSAEENLPALLYFGSWIAACDPVGTAMGLTVAGAFPDCDGNGVADVCELSVGGFTDCNGNFSPDQCDISSGSSLDCDENGVPDECAPDCNGNGVPDPCDIMSGLGVDCNGNGRLDECDVVDPCGPPIGSCPQPGSCLAPSGHASPGCACAACCAAVCSAAPYCCNVYWDGVCAIEAGNEPACAGADGPPASADCNGNQVPDECETDCNFTGVPDECEIASGASADCDGNGSPDECDPNTDGDAFIDACDVCPLDVDDDLDQDGVCAPFDECPGDPEKTAPGGCGCGVVDSDSDQDGTLDCTDRCDGADDDVFGPGCDGKVPAASAWGLLTMALLLSCAAKITFGTTWPRRPPGRDAPFPNSVDR